MDKDIKNKIIHSVAEQQRQWLEIKRDFLDGWDSGPNEEEDFYRYWGHVNLRLEAFLRMMKGL